MQRLGSRVGQRSSNEDPDQHFVMVQAGFGLYWAHMRKRLSLVNINKACFSLDGPYQTKSTVSR